MRSGNSLAPLSSSSSFLSPSRRVALAVEFQRLVRVGLETDVEEVFQKNRAIHGEESFTNALLVAAKLPLHSAQAVSNRVDRVDDKA